MEYKTQLTPLGDFSISGKMRVSDPCYKPDVWCSGTLDTEPGIWEAAVLILDDEKTGGWGNRVAVLAAKHEDCSIPLETITINSALDKLPPLSKDWGIADFEVGVDSGQAGFYDNDNFIARNGGEDDVWYDKMCDITLSRAQAGVFFDGVVTSSGYGDGGYPCIYHKSIDGKIDFAFIVFIENDEDDEDEEEGY